MLQKVVCEVKICKKNRNPLPAGEGGSVVMSIVYFLLEEVDSVLLSSLFLATLPLSCLTTVSFATLLSLLLREVAAGADVCGLLVLFDSALGPACEEVAGLETEVPDDLLLVLVL